MEGISESLQLIGEAYISEDSQETNSVENDSRKEELLVSFKDVSSTHCIKEEKLNTQDNKEQVIDNNDAVYKDLMSVEDLQDSLQHKNVVDNPDEIKETLDISNKGYIESISVHSEKKIVEDNEGHSNLVVNLENTEQSHNMKEINSELSETEEISQREESIIAKQEEINICKEIENSPEHKVSSAEICSTNIVPYENIEQEKKSEISDEVEEEVNTNILVTNTKLEEDKPLQSDDKLIDIQALQNESVTESKHSTECYDKIINSIEPAIDEEQNKNFNTSEDENVNSIETVTLSALEDKNINST